MVEVEDELGALLDAEPEEGRWRRLCKLAEDLPAEQLAEVELQLREWPARLRVMPDEWWVRWRDGDRQPHHRLAAYRRLGDWATGPHDSPRDFDDARLEFGHLGGVALACSSDLRWVLAGGTFQPHHSGGEVQLWGTGPDASLGVLLGADMYHGETHAALFIPDSAMVVAVPEEDCLHGWLTVWDMTCDVVWRWRLTERDFDEDAGDDGLERVGLATSGDGRLVAAASWRDGVVALATPGADQLVRVLIDDVAGPVALDHTGQRVAYAVADGVLVVRDTDSEEVLLRHRTGLSDVDAVTFAPDGSAVVAVCAATVCVVSLDGDRVTGARVVEPACDLAGQVRVATQVTWGEHGLHVFVTGDSSAVFDGDGRVLWRQPGGMVGAFSPDGRVFVTAAQDDGAVEAWFLDAIR